MNQGVPLTHPLAFSAPTPRPAVRARAGQLRRTRCDSDAPFSLIFVDEDNKAHSYSARRLASEMRRAMRLAQPANGCRCAQTPPFLPLTGPFLIYHDLFF